MLPKSHVVNKAEATRPNDFHNTLCLFSLYYILNRPWSNMGTYTLIYASSIPSHGQLVLRLMVMTFIKNERQDLL